MFLLSFLPISRNEATFNQSLESLANEIMQAVPSGMDIKAAKAAGALSPAPVKAITKKPGRAFRHVKTGKFLAESGMLTVRNASGLLDVKPFAFFLRNLE